MLSSRIILLSGGTGLACLLLCARLKTAQIQCHQTATADHAKSQSVALMNPLGHPAQQQDSYTLRIPVHKLQRGISDEEILARFTYGHYGGWVLTPERWLLRIFKPSITHISALDEGGSLPQLSLTPTIWSLTRTGLPPLGSRLFGVFLLLDCSVANPQERGQKHSSAPSHRSDHVFAEFVAGSDKSAFAVSQRFEIARQQSGTNDETNECVTITASHLLCNPLGGRSVFPGWMRGFHGLYARLLFADGIREVMK
ncbi:hypothetical protein HD806DRAFT_518941 [Xylariaceae sp. AK1471]|nr:hypothetical protein HD806DRAFT_518941 [Xylariaceae sp. AK1471]